MCSAEESRRIGELCKTNPEVLAEVIAIEKALMSYSEAVAPELFVATKERLFNKINESKPAAVVSSEKVSSKVTQLYSYISIAASMLLVVSLGVNFVLYTKVQKLDSELSELQQEKDFYAEQLKVQQVKLDNQHVELAVLSDPNVKKVKLSSTANVVGNEAMVYWNTNNNQAYLSLVHLPSPPAGKQYQLWAIVDGKPVDAGVFSLPENNAALQKMKSIANVQAFAVTLENEGGSTVPTLATLCISGNV